MESRPGLLRFETISKRFGGTLALDKVSIDPHRGEILALLGENGTGKPTLIRSVTRAGRQPNLSSPATAVDSDDGLIAGDGTEESVAMALTIRDVARRDTREHRVRWRAEQRVRSQQRLSRRIPQDLGKIGHLCSVGRCRACERAASAPTVVGQGDM